LQSRGVTVEHNCQ